MKIPSRLPSRWVRLPLLGAALLLPGAGGHAAHQLRTIQPAMYDRAGVVDSGQCSEDDDVETIVFTSLRPGNLDVYLFDRDGARPRRLTDHGNLDYNPSIRQTKDASSNPHVGSEPGRHLTTHCTCQAGTSCH